MKAKIQLQDNLQLEVSLNWLRCDQRHSLQPTRYNQQAQT